MNLRNDVAKIRGAPANRLSRIAFPVSLWKELGRVIVHIEVAIGYSPDAGWLNRAIFGILDTFRCFPDAAFGRSKLGGSHSSKSANVLRVGSLNSAHPNTPCFESLDNLAATFVTIISG